MDLTLNYLQWLICQKTKPKQTYSSGQIIFIRLEYLINKINYVKVQFSKTILLRENEWLIVNKIIGVW